MGTYLRSNINLLASIFLFNVFDVLFNSLELKKHPLDFTIIVFSKTLNLVSQQIDLLIFLLLPLNENDAVIKTFLHQMNFEVFSEHFNFAP